MSSLTALPASPPATRPRVDVHQHLWTAPLLELLAEREQPPMIRRRHGLTVLHCAGEQPCLIDVRAEAPELRARLVLRDGLDHALIAPSSPIGIEALPREHALELIDAHLHGVCELPSLFSAWGPLALDGASAADVDALAERGCVGVSIPAGALATPEWLERVGPLLERIARLRLPLLVHPGRAPARRQARCRWPSRCGGAR